MLLSSLNLAYRAKLFLRLSLGVRHRWLGGWPHTQHPPPVDGYPEQVFTRRGEPIPYPFGYTERVFTRDTPSPSGDVSGPRVSIRRHLHAETSPSGDTERMSSVNKCSVGRQDQGIPPFPVCFLFFWVTPST